MSYSVGTGSPSCLQPSAWKKRKEKRKGEAKMLPTLIQREREKKERKTYIKGHESVFPLEGQDFGVETRTRSPWSEMFKVIYGAIEVGDTIDRLVQRIVVAIHHRGVVFVFLKLLHLVQGQFAQSASFIEGPSKGETLNKELEVLEEQSMRTKQQYKQNTNERATTTTC